jgi:protein-disulfide isomerase
VVSTPVSAASLDPNDRYHELQNQIEQLRQDYKVLENQLKEIRDFIQGRTVAEPPLPEHLSIDGHPFKGDKNAKVTIVEFSDYECPFCGVFFSETLPKIEQEFISTGKLKYVRRDFPLVSMHQNAMKAAEAAICAGKQEKYWEMHGRLFAHQNQLGRSDLLGYAKAIGLNMGIFEQCFTAGQEAMIRRDMEEGLTIGVQGTPTIFLGLRDGNNQIKIVKRIAGAQPYGEFRAAIQSILNEIDN